LLHNDKGSIQQEYTTFVNICAPIIEALKYIKQILTNLKGEIDSNRILRDFNISLTSVDRSSRQKINKETSALNDTLDQMALTDIYRMLYLKATE